MPLMLGDNIKKHRREKGYTQEELAAKVHVVRQTLSKWENNTSVPDAEMLLEIAGALDVSVAALLGIPPEEPPADLAAELARVNGELAERNLQLQRIARVNSKRGQILFLSFAALLVSAAVRNPLLSLAAVGACLLLALWILYRNLPLLTESTVSKGQMNVLKGVTICNGVLFAALLVFSGLLEAGCVTLTERQGQYLLMGIFSCLFLFFGALSPRLPYQRHTGLRLPWTVQDEETWRLAHRLLGIISLPVTLLYLAAALAVRDLEQVGRVSLIAMAVYIGIPGVLSLLFFWKKLRA